MKPTSILVDMSTLKIQECGVQKMFISIGREEEVGPISQRGTIKNLCSFGGT
jgi:hypothetical protein